MLVKNLSKNKFDNLSDTARDFLQSFGNRI